MIFRYGSCSLLQDADLNLVSVEDDHRSPLVQFRNADTCRSNTEERCEYQTCLSIQSLCLDGDLAILLECFYHTDIFQVGRIYFRADLGSLRELEQCDRNIFHVVIDRLLVGRTGHDDRPRTHEDRHGVISVLFILPDRTFDLLSGEEIGPCAGRYVVVAVLLGSYGVYRAVKSGKEQADAESPISESTDHPNGTISQTYTIMVAGQGLREDNSIPFENLTSQLTGMSMFYSNYKFECELPLSVVGDNVESVEYSFKNADVAIVHNGTSPDNITGEKIDLDDRYLSDWEDEPNRYCIGNKQFDAGTVDFYHAYKETAPFGSGENIKKYLCVLTEGRSDLYEHQVLREKDNYDPFNCDFLTAMCKDIVVTVKVNFKDGSSEVTDI